MSRFRAFALISAVAVLGACSDSETSPTSPSQPDASLQQQQSATATQEVTAGVRKGSIMESQEGIGAEHTLRTCNRYRTECITIWHSGNLVTRVLSEGVAQGPGCSRVYFYVNGVLNVYSRPVCHNRGDVLFSNWYPRARAPFGTMFKSDWRGSAYSPPGVATQRF